MKRIVIIFILVLFLSACNNSTDFEEPDAVTGQDSLDELDNAPSQNETAEPEPEQGDAKEELQEYLRMRPDYRAEYLVNSNVGGESFSGVEVIAVKGENNLRQYANESMYIIGDEVYVCYKEMQTNCYNIPQEQPPEETEIEIPEEVMVERLPDRNIAGMTAECYRMIGDETATDCRSDEGILLYFLRSTSDYEIEYIAQEITARVESDIFDLPVEPQEFDPSVFETS